MLSLKASRTLSKINDIVAVVAGVDEDYGHSCLGLGVLDDVLNGPDML